MESHSTMFIAFLAVTIEISRWICSIQYLTELFLQSCLYVKKGSKQPLHRYNTPHFAHWWLQACSIVILFNWSLQNYRKKLFLNALYDNIFLVTYTWWYFYTSKSASRCMCKIIVQSYTVTLLVINQLYCIRYMTRWNEWPSTILSLDKLFFHTPG